MSNSVFSITEPDGNDSLTLVVSPDGSISPDKATVRSILSTRPSVDINLMTMEKIEAGKVNVILDSLTYVNSEEFEDREEMDEIARNLMSFRMDHDYTPLTSPTRRPRDIEMVDDELAQTLSLLEEGGLLPQPQTRSEPLTKITKIVKGKKQTMFVNSKQKAKMISTGLLKERPSAEGTVFKKPKPIVTGKTVPKPKTPVKLAEVPVVIIEELKKVEVAVPKVAEPEDMEDEEGLFDDEEEDLEDDENDSDFELEEELKQQTARKLRTRTKSETGRQAKIENTKQKLSPRAKQPPPSLEKVEPEIVKPSEPVPPEKPVEAKPSEKKPTPKKEKKVPKPMPDDFALFSTPDIIRRVGKEPTSPEKPVSPSPKPAKISPENRSKSNTVDAKSKRLSTDTKNAEKSPEKTRRLSLDVRKQDRRPSVDVKAKIEEQVSVQEFADTLSNSNESITEDQLEPLPSAEDIRAIIQNENTKSFSTSLIIPDPADLPTDDHTMNLETGGLELDQSILDNINTDMINEDILYQVAQSLVGNTELQNAIDKSLVDGNLVLDASLQHTMPPGLVEGLDSVGSGIDPQPDTTNVPDSGYPRTGTQIVRPDGRVVVIPPIERPTTRSRNRKRNASPPQPVRQPKPVLKPLDEEHVSGNELDSSEEEEADEDESEDDPNKLWCICNQPHNNRFMICCDTCEEWYHGKCVNVTKVMGQAMEQQGKEWICIYCRDASLTRPKAAARRIRKASRTSTDSGGGSAKKMNSGPASSSSSTASSHGEERKTTGPGCVVCGKPSRNSSIYCSDSCILKHAQGVEKVVVFDRKSGRLLSGGSAPSAANLDKWLAENPTYEVVRSTNKPITTKPPPTLTQTKLKLVKNTLNDGVSLAVHKKGTNIGILQHAPKVRTITQQPGQKITPKKTLTGNITGLKIISKQGPIQNKIKVIPASPIISRPTLTSVPAKQAKLIQSKMPSSSAPTSKDKLPMPQKTPKARQAEVTVQPKQPENLRETVRKTFLEQLANRLKKVEDLHLTEDELKSISNEIESQLYKCFGDTGQKYKNKYRSLIFNIKDPKNQTLWRRICEKAVNAYQLVRLSPDDLASQELALWREREAKHQLDMIKKSELELLNCTRQYVFKTHKGEQVFEDDRPKDQVTEVISGLGADSTSLENEDVEMKEKEKKPAKHFKQERSKERGRELSRDDSKSRRDKGDSKERRKERMSSSRERKRRSKSKEHGSRHGERKRSRSRERHRKSSHKSSKHKKEDKTIGTERLDKKSKEILEQLVDKHIVPPLEDRLWKHVPQEDVQPTPTIESDSDHEPSSTVTIPTPPRSSEPEEPTPSRTKVIGTEPEKEQDDNDSGGKSPRVTHLSEVIWKGSISMIDVAQISITAHVVSGDCQGLGSELPHTLDIVGRISPETVWDYIGKMKSSNSKTISVLRLTATNMEERMPYLALYSYLSSRNRLGVVKSVIKAVKDFYILPLAGHTPIPDPLLPLSGPGFEDSRPALLLGVIVRDRRKRATDSAGSSKVTTKRIRVDIVLPTASATPPSSSRSYTPPPSRDPRKKVSAVPLPSSTPEMMDDEPEDDMDEPYSPEDSDPDTMPELTNSRLNADDISNLLTGSMKSSSFLESGLSTQSFEPFSNKFDSIPGLDVGPTLPSNSLDLQRKMAELDQRIAAQRAEIHKVSQDLVSSATSDIGSATLANIALPSDLQQILESIKTIGSKTNSTDSQGENSNSSIPSGAADMTIPLLLPKLSSRPLIGSATAPSITDTVKPPKSNARATEAEKSVGVLSSLSEEDLIKKAEEMLAAETN